MFSSHLIANQPIYDPCVWVQQVPLMGFCTSHHRCIWEQKQSCRVAAWKKCVGVQRSLSIAVTDPVKLFTVGTQPEVVLFDSTVPSSLRFRTNLWLLPICLPWDAPLKLPCAVLSGTKHKIKQKKVVMQTDLTWHMTSITLAILIQHRRLLCQISQFLAAHAMSLALHLKLTAFCNICNMNTVKWVVTQSHLMCLYW